MRTLALAAALVLLCGCASEPPLAPPPAVAVTPPVTQVVEQVCSKVDATWTDAEFKALAGEISPIPPASTIIKMALEWKRLRDDAVACQTSQHVK